MKPVKKYKLSRRLGFPIFEKCQTQKFALSESKKKPSRFNRQSEYGKQLLEKQKLRFLYNLNEKTLKNYVKRALSRSERGQHEDKLVSLLENRIDSVVYLLGLADTRRMARQIVSHGHIMVNGVRTTVPSMHIKVSDTLTIREKSKKSFLFDKSNKKIKPISSSVKWDSGKSEGVVVGESKVDSSIINLSVVFEYYSR